MKRVFVLLSFLCLLAGMTSAKKVKTLYRNSLILAYSKVNSVYEDDNIKLEIYNQRLWITNKTPKAIFIDRSQCFFINNGSSYPMWEKDQNEKMASKAKVTNSIDEFLSISPSTGMNQNPTVINWVGQRIYGNYSTTEGKGKNEEFSEYDKRLLNIVGELAAESLKTDSKKKNYLGTVSRHLTEDESISNIGASIAYAFSKRSEEWTSVTISTWVSDVIFAPFYIEMPDELSKKEKQGFGVKESKPAVIHIKADSPFEFEEDKSPMIVCDWEGNYKKGTFVLKPVIVTKTNKVGLLANLFTLGYASLFANLSPKDHKDIIYFDGVQDDWGEMIFTKGYRETKRQ